METKKVNKMETKKVNKMETKNVNVMETKNVDVMETKNVDVMENVDEVKRLNDLFSELGIDYVSNERDNYSLLIIYTH